jgi:hypothetical protein
MMEHIECGPYPNSLPRRLNNPGAISFAKWEVQYGAQPSTNHFARFPTYSLGKRAQLHLLNAAFSDRMTAYRSTMSPDQFIRAYASTSPEIEKQNYVSRVCEFLKVPKTTQVKTLL